jgi:cytochrome oxidase Cu insertion factor (SCO1/SenC/PrrC family)
MDKAALKSLRTRVVLTLGALALAAAAAIAITAAGGSNGEGSVYIGSTPPAGFTLPEFELSDHTGAVVRSRDLDGKVVVVTFLDTQCTSSCPVIASQIGFALDRLTPGELRDVVPIAITSDPPEDTPESVQAFLRRHRVEGRLRYLVGAVPEVRPVWNAFQVASSFDTGVDDLHSAPVRIFDRHGAWVSTLHAGADLTPENLAHDLGVALAQE